MDTTSESDSSNSFSFSTSGENVQIEPIVHPPFQFPKFDPPPVRRIRKSILVRMFEIQEKDKEKAQTPKSNPLKCIASTPYPHIQEKDKEKAQTPKSNPLKCIASTPYPHIQEKDKEKAQTPKSNPLKCIASTPYPRQCHSTMPHNCNQSIQLSPIQNEPVVITQNNNQVNNRPSEATKQTTNKARPNVTAGKLDGPSLPKVVATKNQLKKRNRTSRQVQLAIRRKSKYVPGTRSGCESDDESTPETSRRPSPAKLSPRKSIKDNRTTVQDQIDEDVSSLTELRNLQAKKTMPLSDFSSGSSLTSYLGDDNKPRFYSNQANGTDNVGFRKLGPIGKKIDQIQILSNVMVCTGRPNNNNSTSVNSQRRSGKRVLLDDEYISETYLKNISDKIEEEEAVRPQDVTRRTVQLPMAQRESLHRTDLDETVMSSTNKGRQDGSSRRKGVNELEESQDRKELRSNSKKRETNNNVKDVSNQMIETTTTQSKNNTQTEANKPANLFKVPKPVKGTINTAKSYNKIPVEANDDTSLDYHELESWQTDENVSTHNEVSANNTSVNLEIHANNQTNRTPKRTDITRNCVVILTKSVTTLNASLTKLDKINSSSAKSDETPGKHAKRDERRDTSLTRSTRIDITVRKSGKNEVSKIRSGKGDDSPVKSRERPTKAVKRDDSPVKSRERPTKAVERDDSPVKSRERPTKAVERDDSPVKSRERPTKAVERDDSPVKSRERPTKAVERDDSPVKSRERPTKAVERDDSPVKSRERPTKAVERDDSPVKSRERHVSKTKAGKRNVSPTKTTQSVLQTNINSDTAVGESSKSTTINRNKRNVSPLKEMQTSHQLNNDKDETYYKPVKQKTNKTTEVRVAVRKRSVNNTSHYGTRQNSGRSQRNREDGSKYMVLSRVVSPTYLKLLNKYGKRQTVLSSTTSKDYSKRKGNVGEASKIILTEMTKKVKINNKPPNKKVIRTEVMVHRSENDETDEISARNLPNNRNQKNINTASHQKRLNDEEIRVFNENSSDEINSEKSGDNNNRTTVNNGTKSNKQPERLHMNSMIEEARLLKERNSLNISMPAENGEDFDEDLRPEPVELPIKINVGGPVKKTVLNGRRRGRPPKITVDETNPIINEKEPVAPIKRKGRPPKTKPILNEKEPEELQETPLQPSADSGLETEGETQKPPYKKNKQIEKEPPKVDHINVVVERKQKKETTNIVQSKRRGRPKKVKDIQPPEDLQLESASDENEPRCYKKNCNTRPPRTPTNPTNKQPEAKKRRVISENSDDELSTEDERIRNLNKKRKENDMTINNVSDNVKENLVLREVDNTPGVRLGYHRISKKMKKTYGELGIIEVDPFSKFVTNSNSFAIRLFIFSGEGRIEFNGNISNTLGKEILIPRRTFYSIMNSSDTLLRIQITRHLRYEYP